MILCWLSSELTLHDITETSHVYDFPETLVRVQVSVNIFRDEMIHVAPVFFPLLQLLHV